MDKQIEGLKNNNEILNVKWHKQEWILCGGVDSTPPPSPLISSILKIKSARERASMEETGKGERGLACGSHGCSRGKTCYLKESGPVDNVVNEGSQSGAIFRLCCCCCLLHTPRFLAVLTLGQRWRFFHLPGPNKFSWSLKSLKMLKSFDSKVNTAGRQ